MRASFHLAVDKEIAVEPCPYGSIVVRIVDGVYYGDAGEEDKRVTTQLFLKKGTARAIASAMMGCAAEV